MSNKIKRKRTQPKPTILVVQVTQDGFPKEWESVKTAETPVVWSEALESITHGVLAGS